jgi:hypothetical protein
MTTDFESRFADETVALPAGVDAAALRRIERVAWALDDGIPLPGVGYRIGLDPLVGLLPVAGDAVAAAASLYLIAEAARQGVRPATLFRMLCNVGVDVGAGSVPVLGDAFDAVWKANRRNAELAVRELAVLVGGRRRGADQLVEHRPHEVVPALVRPLVDAHAPLGDQRAHGGEVSCPLKGGDHSLMHLAWVLVSEKFSHHLMALCVRYFRNWRA